MDIRDVKEIEDSFGFKFLGVNKDELVGVPVEPLIRTTKAFKSIRNNNTNISPNADFAEVGEWSDGNPDCENRLGYFVSVSKTESGITMVKANSESDVRGVTIENPAFAANASSEKFDESGNLKSQYNYVAFAGFATIIDNGTCVVNERCMPANDGTAIPSGNTMGYQVIERIDDNKVLIIVESNADMLNRIKDDIEKINSELGDVSRMLDDINGEVI